MGSEMGSARLVQLTEGPPGPCFFLIPGTGGKIDGFQSLAPYFDCPIPVVAIEARGLDENSLPETSVEEMTDHYLDLIRSFQTTGPYFLLGHSFGGLVALDMAQRLIAAKQEIGCLIMLDTPTPEKCWPMRYYLKSRWQKLRRQLTRLRTMRFTENVGQYLQRRSIRNVDVTQMSTNVMIGTNVARVLIAHTIARQNYRPRTYPDRIIFFRPTEKPGGYETLWRNRVREMEIMSAEGDHLSMVEPPHGPRLAAALSICIRKAVAATRAGPTGRKRDCENTTLPAPSGD